MEYLSSSPSSNMTTTIKLVRHNKSTAAVIILCYFQHTAHIQLLFPSKGLTAGLHFLVTAAIMALHIYFIIIKIMYCIMCGVFFLFFSWDFYIHMLTHTHIHTSMLVHAFTPTEQEGESATPPWRLKASMSGILPRVCWVKDPTHTHMFKFKVQNIRGRHERLMSINALNAITQANHCLLQRASQTSIFFPPFIQN